ELPEPSKGAISFLDWAENSWFFQLIEYPKDDKLDKKMRQRLGLKWGILWTLAMLAVAALIGVAGYFAAETTWGPVIVVLATTFLICERLVAGPVKLLALVSTAFVLVGMGGLVNRAE